MINNGAVNCCDSVESVIDGGMRVKCWWNAADKENQKSASVRFCTPKTHGLTPWDWTQNYTVRGRRLTAWVSHWLQQCSKTRLTARTNIRHHLTLVTIFCTVALNICASSVWKLLHVTILTPRVFFSSKRFAQSFCILCVGYGALIFTLYVTRCKWWRNHVNMSGLRST
jgi:hypothetical protein